MNLQTRVSSRPISILFSLIEKIIELKRIVKCESHLTIPASGLARALVIVLSNEAPWFSTPTEPVYVSNAMLFNKVFVLQIKVNTHLYKQLHLEHVPLLIDRQLDCVCRLELVSVLSKKKNYFLFSFIERFS